MYKYFYRNGETGEYAILEESDDNFELELYIAEMFYDVFQYTEPLEEYLKTRDKASYVDYKKMITNSPIVQTTIKRNNWHEKK